MRDECCEVLGLWSWIFDKDLRSKTKGLLFTHHSLLITHHTILSVARRAVTSPARTNLILRLPVSTRRAPSLSRPRVVPSNVSLPKDTRTRLPVAYVEFAYHSRIVCSAPLLSCKQAYLSAIAATSSANTCSRSGFAPIKVSIVTAFSRASDKPSWFKLIPMPIIAAGPASVSTVSARIPQSFLSATQISLGHLMSLCKSQDLIKAS